MRLKIILGLSGTICGISNINNVVEYGTTKGSERPKIKKRKDFKIWTRIN